MANYEKPKRKQQTPENETHLIAREFYWNLFVQLMIPALLLAFIFGIPVLALNNLPNRLNAQCAMYNGDEGIRIISETQGTNITTYYWTDNHGETWHIVQSIERPYQSARADCSTVSFSDSTIEIYIDSETTLRLADGELFTE